MRLAFGLSLKVGMRMAAERLRRCRQVHRRFVAGHQALVGVGRRIADGAKRLGVFQNAADVVERHLRKAGVFLASEERLAFFPQRLVRVHAEPLSPKSGLGMNVTRLAVRSAPRS